MTLWLKEYEFEYKNPVKVPSKMDPQKQAAFIKEYEKLKSHLGENEEVYFLDATHPEFQSQATYGWIKKGETKTLGTTNKQNRLHFIGAINLEKMAVMASEYKTVNAENVIDFLEKLQSNSSASKIHLICDNGRANKNKDIKKYIGTSKIEIHYLPPYSPNLNPIERLWKLMREAKVYNRCYENFAEFTEAIREFFWEEIPKKTDMLKQRINDKFQQIELNPIQLAR